MGSILIAMPRAEDANKIAGLVQRSGLLYDTEVCSTGSEVLRIANERDYGVAICSKRMRDMSYLELSGYLPTYFGLILITADASLETYSERCVKLMQPLKRSDLMATIEMLTHGFERSRRKSRQQIKKQRSDEEQKLIDQAKKLLMERNGMSEPEAFRYLQKNSMDFGRTMVESAQMILAMG